MFDWFVARFVGNPVTVAAVAITLATLWLVSRSGRLGGRPGGLAWAAAAWGVWAVWEFALVRFTPEADIRVDLLLLIPAVLASTLGGLAFTLWPGKGDGATGEAPDGSDADGSDPTDR